MISFFKKKNSIHSEFPNIQVRDTMTYRVRTKHSKITQNLVLRGMEPIVSPSQWVWYGDLRRGESQSLSFYFLLYILR